MPTSSSHRVDPAVAALARALRERGLRADLQVVSVCGEPDIRLVICGEGGDVVVELLASPAGSPTPGCWHAVRVLGEDRQVWQGPPHDAPPGAVLAFVEELLADRSPHVHYALLG